tara:strand:- start:596 stop:1366 length:771 start_codon:yes stop_codon:yes gene_type:complete
MAFSLDNISLTKGIKSPMILTHGESGVGKTTFASTAPNPIFGLTEDGTGVLEVDAFPLIETAEDLRSALKSLINDEHTYETFVLDSLDHLEPLIWDEVCKDEKVDDIGKVQGAFFEGYRLALVKWRELVEMLRMLRDEKGMAIILIAHSAPARRVDPETEGAMQMAPKLQKYANEYLCESMDCIFYAKHDEVLKTIDQGFSNTAKKPKELSRRSLQTTFTSSHRAKNRYGLPDEIAMTWAAFEEAAFNKPKNKSET